MKVKQVTADRNRMPLDLPVQSRCSVLIYQSVDPKRDFTLPREFPTAFF